MLGGAAYHRAAGARGRSATRRTSPRPCLGLRGDGDHRLVARRLAGTEDPEVVRPGRHRRRRSPCSASGSSRAPPTGRSPATRSTPRRSASWSGSSSPRRISFVAEPLRKADLRREHSASKRGAARSPPRGSRSRTGSSCAAASSIASSSERRLNTASRSSRASRRGRRSAVAASRSRARSRRTSSRSARVPAAGHHPSASGAEQRLVGLA